MNDILIRRIEKEDNKQMANIIRTVFEEFNLPKVGTVYSDPTTDNLYDLFNREDSLCFVAANKGHVVGGGGIYPTIGLPSGFCEFSKFYLLKEARGLGIGKTILNYCIEGARQIGYKSIYLESFPGLESALEMYKKTGFKYIDKPLGKSGHFACSIWQQLDID